MITLLGVIKIILEISYNMIKLFKKADSKCIAYFLTHYHLYPQETTDKLGNKVGEMENHLEGDHLTSGKSNPYRKTS